ncbi:conserved Plasmodium protein, unknown function [Babesia microti strain RI]|uniref:Uncharacterized protein n=1 Tax=Babesia microti (strain RI) TaxID=1133968 RepID=I7JCV2_BABMR|nr:conserved Plasmodium protein, unknown function [Babesia microti strain RI]CCF75460.1 conserved Plasmodium protein, unknown function [Babesia microti strain RI]|eukprot:XP_012649868.1 conserved Plasmodium protein, unknown function [Babesia microti strain RI]
MENLPNCSDVIQDEELVSNLCRNNATCKIRIHEEYVEALCDCSRLTNNTHYFVGKYCEIAVPHPRVSSNDINDSLNTCFIEDLLGINEWKNNFSIYGKIVN